MKKLRTKRERAAFARGRECSREGGKHLGEGYNRKDSLKLQREGGLAFEITRCTGPCPGFPVDVAHPGIASRPGSQDQARSQSCFCWQSACCHTGSRAGQWELSRLRSPASPYLGETVVGNHFD